jgi:hypothetical protein
MDNKSEKISEDQRIIDELAILEKIEHDLSGPMAKPIYKKMATLIARSKKEHNEIS